MTTPGLPRPTEAESTRESVAAPQPDAPSNDSWGGWDAPEVIVMIVATVLLSLLWTILVVKLGGVRKAMYGPQEHRRVEMPHNANNPAETDALMQRVLNKEAEEGWRLAYLHRTQQMTTTGVPAEMLVFWFTRPKK